jgi:RNA polymerase sigma factor (sigma-70 family)
MARWPVRAGNGEAQTLTLCLPAAADASHDLALMAPDENTPQQIASDDALMSRVHDGEVQALAPLFDRHHAALLNFFFRTIGNRASSEDLVQDVFVRMLNYRRTYRPGSQFLTWMYHIARHARADYHRKRRGEIEWDDAYAPRVFPHDSAESAQQEHYLALALQRLPDDKRELLVLSRFAGMRYEEIGQLLKCEPGAVKVRVHRAMRELRDCFHEITKRQIAQGETAKGENP